MSKLSIITINYNNAEGLLKTIQSVASQTSDAFEYIIIDGGSDDGSVDLIQQHKETIEHWISEPDNGIYHAMNKGIRLAGGDYVQFLNSGDRLASPDVIEKMMDGKPRAGIFYGNMIKEMPDGKELRDTGGRGEISFFKLYRGTINHSPAWIKRNLFEKYGYYDENLQITADWKWYLIVVGLKNESVEYIDIPVTRFDMGGISNTNRQLEMEERQKVLRELLPARILADYHKYETDIMMINRLNRYKLVKRFVWFMERILFKLEKWGFLKR